MPTVTWQFFGWILFLFSSHTLCTGVFLPFISDYSSVGTVVVTFIWIGIQLLITLSLFLLMFKPVDSIPDVFHIPLDLDTKSVTFQHEFRAVLEERGVFSMVDTVDVKDKGPLPITCMKCRVAKPLRCHHCSRCDRCLPRMDHHCPILGICVHEGNHKFFLVLLFWTIVLCAFGNVSMLPIALRVMHMTAYHRIAMIFLPVVPLPFTLPFMAAAIVVMDQADYVSVALVLCTLMAGASMVLQSGFFFLLAEFTAELLVNRTGIERLANGGHVFGALFDLVRCRAIQSAYDKGSFRANFETIFGPNPWLWFLPVVSTSYSTLRNPQLVEVIAH